MGATSFQITVSSTTVSSPQNLDPYGAKFLSFGVTGSSSGTFSATVEGTLQNVQTTTSSALAWFALSSAVTANSSAFAFEGPLGGIRLNVASLSSAVVNLFGLQGIGW
ncbi:hypothetical protein [Bradyrhizobium sp. SZCCHNR3003]|uniref:hypothetical protein n=1 Tax=Bradyrhizobium sp. SZCCHNR3003 TaxID=3057387 RepID=UPI0029170688|nr:hypothetical protein [Bradyrhizobium sp. SZCCHNR3003]